MAFDEVVFPTAISYGASGGPEFNTNVVTSKGGDEARNQNWSEARIIWDVSTGIQSRAHIDELVTFFRNRRGKSRGFLFRDHTDYRVEGGFIKIGDGSTTDFQLVKVYDDGVFSTTRDIIKPENGSVTIYLDGVIQNSGFSLDYTTGILKFSSAPGNSVLITADFNFYVPVRFDTDVLKITLNGYDSWSSDSIPVKELRGSDAISS